MNEFDDRGEGRAPGEDAPRDASAGPQQGGGLGPREQGGDAGSPQAGEVGPPPDRTDNRAFPEGADPRGPRRRGRRGRGPVPFRPGGAPPFRGPAPGAPARGPAARGPYRAPAPPPRRPVDDESLQQTSELAAYERRQMRQQQRGWRPPTTIGGSSSGAGWRPQPAQSGWRPPAPAPGGAWRGGPPARGAPPRGRAPAYQDTIRRLTGGARPAAPSHDAGEPIAGPHAVLEAIRAGRTLQKLYVSQDRSTRTGPVNELIAEAQQRRIFVNFVDKLDLARMSPIENHQGVVAIVQGRVGIDLDELLVHLERVDEPPLVLVVDSLQDPQNFGVLLRSAEGAGAHGVVIPRHRAVGVTAAVAKTSAGASEHLLIADVANLRQAVDTLKEKGIWIVGTDETGDLLYDEVDYRGPTALVIGAEGEGIRRLVLEGCDQVVRIPMEGRISSLNAAAAGTVLLYEALRQRRRDAAPPGTQTPRPMPAGDEAASEEASDLGAREEPAAAAGARALLRDPDTLDVPVAVELPPRGDPREEAETPDEDIDETPDDRSRAVPVAGSSETPDERSSETPVDALATPEDVSADALVQALRGPHEGPAPVTRAEPEEAPLREQQPPSPVKRKAVRKTPSKTTAAKPRKRTVKKPPEG